MGDLKTLRDLETDCIGTIGNDDFSGNHDIVLTDDLRQEAIKWAKHCKELFGTSATLDFWIERFNITEEDLI
jgi:hypothetical protein